MRLNYDLAGDALQVWPSWFWRVFRKNRAQRIVKATHYTTRRMLSRKNCGPLYQMTLALMAAEEQAFERLRRYAEGGKP